MIDNETADSRSGVVAPEQLAQSSRWPARWHLGHAGSLLRRSQAAAAQMLPAVEHGMATVMAPSTLAKATITDRYLGILRTLTSFFAGTTRRAQAVTLTRTCTLRGHGRLETYRLSATRALNADLESKYGQPDLGQVLCIKHTRESLATGLVIRTVHFAITSLARATPEQLLALWHEHQHIENKNHCVRDVVFGEDASRARTGTLPEVLALLRGGHGAFRLASMDGIAAARSQASADLRIAAFLVGIP